jgi:hypothetical protein
MIAMAILVPVVFYDILLPTYSWRGYSPVLNNATPVAVRWGPSHAVYLEEVETRCTHDTAGVDDDLNVAHQHARLDRPIRA